MSVRTEDTLPFLERTRGSLNILEAVDVADHTLEVSLTSFDAVLPVARRKRSATPDAMEFLEWIEVGRGTSMLKFDRGRDGTAEAEPSVVAFHPYCMSYPVHPVKSQSYWVGGEQLERLGFLLGRRC
jgi:hypothetical protein